MTVTSIVNTNSNTAVVVGYVPASLGVILAQVLAAAAETANVHTDRLACDADVQTIQFLKESLASDLSTNIPILVMPELVGDVALAVGSNITTIQENVVTNASLALAPPNTLKGNDTGSIANVADLTMPEVMALLTDFIGDAGAGGAAGLVPAPPAGSSVSNAMLGASGRWTTVPIAIGDAGGGGAAGLVPAPPAGSSAARMFLGADATFQALPINAAPSLQTILSGPSDANGNPTTLPSTSPTLSILTQNITATTPLCVSACGGYNASGPVSIFGYTGLNLLWGGLSANLTNYLFVNIYQNMLLGGLSSTLPPIYSWGGTPSVTAGQFTYDMTHKIAYMGNGTLAQIVTAVPFGECVTNGTTVTSAIAYAYNRRYNSGWVTPVIVAAGGNYSSTSNLGIAPHAQDVQLTLQCLTAELGYSIGDRTNPENVSMFFTAYTVGYSVSSTAAMSVYCKNTGVLTAITAANWEMKILVGCYIA